MIVFHTTDRLRCSNKVRMIVLVVLAIATVGISVACRTRNAFNAINSEVPETSDNLTRLVAPSQSGTMVFHWVSNPAAMDSALSDPHSYVRQVVRSARELNSRLSAESLSDQRTASAISHGHGLYLASGPFSDFRALDGRGVLLVLTIPAGRSIIHANEYRFGNRSDLLLKVVRDERYGAISFPWQNSGPGRRAVVVRDLGILGSDGNFDVVAREIKPMQVSQSAGLQLGPRSSDTDQFRTRYLKMLQKYSGVFLSLGQERTTSSNDVRANSQTHLAEAEQILLRRFVDELDSREPECAKSWPCRSLLVQGIDASIYSDDNDLPSQNSALNPIQKSDWYKSANPKTFGQLRKAVLQLMESAETDTFKAYYEEAKQEFAWANPILKTQSLEAFRKEP
jgi:hypothetical protein